MTIKRKINNTVVNEYLTFILGSMKYAIELLKIKKILTCPELITILPNTNDLVKWLINLRGEVVPILDTRIDLIQVK